MNHPLFAEVAPPETLQAPRIVYLPTCGVCWEAGYTNHLIYDGNHAMHCPGCDQVYSCLEPPVNYLDMFELELEPHAP